MQIQYPDPSQPTGMIYGLQMPQKVLGGEERWVPMAIECKGPVTTVRVEGQVVNVYRETKLQKGVLGLQVHGGKPHDHIVKFRNLRVSV
ncbi:MAG: family 16 glycoside hydrolase [Bryobacterales bacterium]